MGSDSNGEREVGATKAESRDESDDDDNGSEEGGTVFNEAEVVGDTVNSEMGALLEGSNSVADETDAESTELALEDTGVVPDASKSDVVCVGEPPVLSPENEVVEATL